MEEYKQYLEQLKNNPPPLAINVVGPINGGKGTQCAILSKALGIPAISVGDLIRREQASGSELGEQFKYYTENRLIAPASMTLTLLAKRLCEQDCKNGYILEGYPRTWENAKGIRGYINFDMVMELQVPEKVLFERMAARGRSDDKQDKQNVGLSIYNAETLPIAKTLVDEDRYFVIKEVDTNFDLVRDSGLDGFNFGEFASLEYCKGNSAERKQEQKEAIYKYEFCRTKFDDYGELVAQALGIDLNDDLDIKTITKFINTRHTNMEILQAIEVYKTEEFLDEVYPQLNELKNKLGAVEDNFFKNVEERQKILENR
ncbi:MAG: nucleoside monophosphate kinase [Christensenellaceae bacterium]|nr:nucleoside monophosphate kinase [Christensenellaceae bacterium]